MKNVISKIFYGLTAVCFTTVVFISLFFNRINERSVPAFLGFICLGIIVLLGVYLLTKRFERFFSKNYVIVLVGFLAVYLFLLIFFGLRLKYTPMYDMDAIYSGAIDWINNGTFINYYSYFGKFRNNLGSMTFLFFVFSAANKFGISDYFTVGVVINSVMLAFTALFTSLIADKIIGRAAAITALFVFVFFMPLLFMGAIFYTDSLSLVFPVALYLAYLWFKDIKNIYVKICLAVFMGIAAAAGSLIKITVLIMLIAIVIDSFISQKLRYTAIIVAFCALIPVFAHYKFNSYIDRDHLKDAQYEQLKTPIAHWLMMGLNEGGKYRKEDYDYTWSFPLDKRSEACVKMIKERLSDMGFGGFLAHLGDKSMVCFDDGTLAEHEVLDDFPQYDTALHELILTEGKYYKTYSLYVTGIMYSFYIFMIAGCVKEIVSKRKNDAVTALAPVLSTFGIWAFLMLWETNSRYITNLITMFIICALMGIHHITEKHMKK